MKIINGNGEADHDDGEGHVCQFPAEQAMMVAASGGMVIPPKLLPDTTTPVMRPIEWGNHNPTIFPGRQTVAPGKTGVTPSADNVYQCHNSVINTGRNKNPTAINTNDTNITGRTRTGQSQYRRSPEPISGDKRKRANDRFNSV